MDWTVYGITENRIITEAQIKQTENILGHIFPSLYIDLILFANDASPEIGCFEYNGNEETAISEFFDCFPYIEPYTILWYKNSFLDIPKEIVPVARDAGDYLICLDFNHSPAHVVIFNPIEKNFLKVANSFEEFVGLWHE